MWDMREADGLLHCERTQKGRHAFEKMLQNSYKWRPERLVSLRTTLIPPLGLCGESLTPTYTVNGKVTFEKWGPHRDLIYWLTPRRGVFSPGRQCDLDWDDHTLVWIFSLSPHGHKHTQIISILISSWDKKATRGENCECVQYKADQTNKHCNGFHMPGVHYISMFPTRGITSSYERPELLFQAFNNTSARRCLLQVNYRAGIVYSFKKKNNKKSTFRTRGNKVSFWADTGHNGVCLSN